VLHSFLKPPMPPSLDEATAGNRQPTAGETAKLPISLVGEMLSFGKEGKTEGGVKDRQPSLNYDRPSIQRREGSRAGGAAKHFWAGWRDILSP
jgi:hypothetical protein